MLNNHKETPNNYKKKQNNYQDTQYNHKETHNDFNCGETSEVCMYCSCYDGLEGFVHI